MTTEEKLAALEEAIKRMHKADEAYGCGFYSDSAWLDAYEETYRLVFKRERDW